MNSQPFQLAAHDLDALARAIAQQLRESPAVPVEWLSPRQAAEYLGCTVRCLEARRQRGAGPRFHKLGGRVVRYHLDDLRAEMRKSEAPPR